MEKAIIIDIDGTISDSRERVRILEEMKDQGVSSNERYKVFYDTAKNDKPLRGNIDKKVVYYTMQKDFYEDEELVTSIFLTGRPERIREDTLKWIKKHLEGSRFNPDILIMRKDTDFSKDLEYKKRELKKIKEKYEVQLVFEDRKHLVEMFKEELPNCKVVWMEEELNK